MVRPTQLLHPQREPAPLRPAATVLLLRDGADGIEILMTRRSLAASFAPGAYVFPGGGIDDTDAHPHTHALADRRATQSDTHLTAAIAAIRESFEELGVVLARGTDGAHPSPDELAALDRDQPFLTQVQARGWRLAADGVHMLAHWITDRDLPRRFDVPFLVARMPDGQTPVADDQEQFEPIWVRPADALARHAEGRFFIIFPTIRTLQRLQHHTSVDSVLAACGEQPLWVSCPRAGLLKGEDSRHMEHEAPFGELELVCPDGQLLHPLDWQHERPVPLLKNVQRLTCANANVMTGPGTNSYIVGDARTGHIVIDPGPVDAAHQQRLFDACGGDIRAIVCTHSHGDHSPGAAPLQALCAAANPSRTPPILGLPSGPHARPGSAFTPDRALTDGEKLTLGDGDNRHTMRVVHTPGHAANHLCLVLEEDGLLFSGDHILNGSTTIIDTPDGDMTAYLDALAHLQTLANHGEIAFILPAHGHVLGSAGEVIAHLTAHRLKREAQVAAAMQALPHGTPDDWVPLAYADTPSALWPLAKRSLLAHVVRLQALKA